MTSTVEVRIGHAAPVEQKKVDDVVWDDAVWAGRQIWHEAVSLRRQGRHGAVRAGRQIWHDAMGAGRQIWHENLWRQHRHEAVRAVRQIRHKAEHLRKLRRGMWRHVWAGCQIWHKSVRLRRQGWHDAVSLSRQGRHEVVRAGRWTWESSGWQQQACRHHCPLCPAGAAIGRGAKWPNR